MTNCKVIQQLEFVHSQTKLHLITWNIHNLYWDEVIVCAQLVLGIVVADPLLCVSCKVSKIIRLASYCTRMILASKERYIIIAVLPIEHFWHTERIALINWIDAREIHIFCLIETFTTLLSSIGLALESSRKHSRVIRKFVRW